MNLNEWFFYQPRGAKSQMANQLNISKNWMSRLVCGTAKPSPYLAIQIEKFTAGEVSRYVLLPEVFKR